MFPKISKIAQIRETVTTACLIGGIEDFVLPGISEKEKKYAAARLEKETDCIIYRYPGLVFLYKHNFKPEKYLQTEAARKAGAKLAETLKNEKITEVQIENTDHSELVLPFLEGLLLASYSFDKYKTQKDEFLLKEIFIIGTEFSANQFEEITNTTQAVFYARNLVNEPLSFLSAVQFSKEIEKLGEEAGFNVEVFHKQKIEALKMGGLLAVNKGSIDPPTFTILEWKPENAKNTQPIVLVGKGVVFDTGGLSLKPTPKSMDYMKSDMAGAAVVAATVLHWQKTKSRFM